MTKSTIEYRVGCVYDILQEIDMVIHLNEEEDIEEKDAIRYGGVLGY